MFSDVLTIPTNFGSGSASDRPIAVRDFVIGPENAVVVESIVRPLLEESEVEFFPVLIFGKTGAGKTHLLRTLASFVTENATISDSTSFSAGCTEATKLDEMAAFETRFLKCQFLFFDDVDHLKSKPVAQQRFMRILQIRGQCNKPTIITSKHPSLSLNLSPSLVSRLSQGVTVPLEYPSNATREQLIRVLASRSGLSLENETILNIAQHNVTAPALLSQMLTLRTTGTPLDQLTQIQTSPDAESPVDPRALIRVTAKYYGLTPRDLCGSSRRKQHVLARSMAMYLVRLTTHLSYQDIGQMFGKRDHTTVMHAYRKIQTLLDDKDESNTKDTKSDILNRYENEC